MKLASRLVLPICFALSFAGCSTPSKDNSASSASSNSDEPPASVDGGPSSNSSGDVDLTADAKKSDGGQSSEIAAHSAATEPMPSGAERYVALGKAVRTGNGDGIRTETTKILGRDASDPVALNAVALYYYRKGQIGAAKTVLEKAFEKNSNNASLYNNLGVMNMMQDEMGAAIANFKKALSIDPGHVSASENLGAIYVAGGNFTRATGLLETAYKAKRSASAGVNYAIALRNAKKYGEAEQVYQDVIKSYPRDVNAHINYALLLIDYLNKPKDGLALVNKVKFLETERRDVLALTNALEQKAKGEIKE